MRYRISQVKLNITDDKSMLERAVVKRLGKRRLRVRDIKIVRESIDARRKPDIKLVYTVDFSCDEKLNLDSPKEVRYDLAKLKAYVRKAEEAPRPVVAGFGPAGIFAALILAQAGLRPIVIERGETVEQRAETVRKFWATGKLNPESNVQFGEGGAGTFSDGKLTTGIKDMRITKVLEEFVEAGADERIMYRQKPHIGTDKLREIVKRLREKIESLGGEIYFCQRLADLEIKEEGQERRLSGIYVEDCRGQEAGRVADGKKKESCGRFYRYIKTDALILATGHSARDTFKMLYQRGIDMEQKPFSIGVRIQHPQRIIDEAQYGSKEAAKLLGAAEYKLNHRCKNGRGVYTFCMCPGGEIIDSSSEENTAVTNGMSNSDRGGKFANSGLLVDVRTDDFGSEHPLAGIDFQRKYERLAYEAGGGRLPESTYGSFKENEADPVRRSLPDFAAKSIVEAMPFMGRKLKGFDSEDAVFKGVETRSSSPVRIVRDERGESAVKGLFPAGEGPGYAGGIMSAAVDGIKAAEKLIKVIFS